MSELIGKVTGCDITDNGLRFSVTKMIDDAVRNVVINKITFGDVGSTFTERTCGSDKYVNWPSFKPEGYSFNLFDSNIPAKPFTAYAPVPRIYDIKVYNDKVVKVFFNDGTTETAVCQEGDKFDLDMGITVCIMKKMLGRNEYFRMLKKAKKNAAAHRELEKKSAEAVEIRKRQRAKEEARKKARRERKNKELATAIAEAMIAKKK